MNLTGQKPYQKYTVVHKKAKLTDRPYLDWLKTQPSALSGLGPCDPCHYRTAKNAGIGTKPLYSAVPLTREEHLEQHRIGTFNFQPRIWWELQCSVHLGRWKESLK